ncbi:signal recognition particle-docking protein FtsY [Streptococcus sp. HF-1907]|uniref:signal recognition particle-docking protein FtsY n=1 Tax=Streptococcus sp. HF-1907 TaxID=2785793 RepID=UPI0018A11CCC|nr:signal recognition particle-docking protein FtsY [Streptococcus sp. HF-1907]MBF7094729.1 signal recognition particle-docking protein FtsY [Streptococcus sp. HF-1907]
MGLFDRLFGKEERSQEETSEELVESTVDSSSEVSEESVVQASESSQENSESSSEASSEAVAVASESEVVSEFDVASDLASSEEASAESESEKRSNNAAAEAFMADYYAKRAAIEKQIADGTFVKPEAQVATASAHASEEVVEEAPQETTEDKYNRSLRKTRTGFSARLNAFLANFRRVDEDFFEELEEMLILSDVGVNVATQLTEDLRYEAKLENAKKVDDLKRVIIEKLVDIYEKDGVYNEKINFQDGLTVMLFVGVNGVGKTTSIGKLAHKYKNEGKKVMLVAADTFRAGAVAQLVEWGRRVDVPVVTGSEKADPASVVFDGMEKAVAEKVDILLIDTAGRLQNKDNLMAELEKIGRIIKRVVPDAPHETLLALDASTGQNALSQAKEFSKITPLTGLILTKIDGTAKGGVVLAIRQELDIPVKFIGFGEKIDDIGEFNSEDFMRGLLEGVL